MKKVTTILALCYLTITSVFAQSKNEKQMEKRIINPWQWQDGRSYVQAVEVTEAKGTLYVSGQTAIGADGVSSNADMKSQIIQTLQNLEKVITAGGYECKNIVRLNIYTTSNEEFFANFDIVQAWIAKHKIKQTSTVLEVKSLYEALKVELEATVVK